MLRTRVSHLEQFRRLVQTDYVPEQELVLAIQGQPFAPNWMMERGTEWHRLLASEDHNVVRYGKPTERGDCPYRFQPEDVLIARKFLGEGLWEHEGRRIFDLGRTSLEVKGTADWLWGRTLQDSKTKTSSPDPRDYEPSLQWRFYLLIHQADVFRYVLWYFSDPDEKTGLSVLKDVCLVNFWRYPGLEQDCRDWCSQFLEWADGKGLLPYLEKTS